MIEIVFDTETTGFDPNTGDRLIEVGCVVLDNGIPDKSRVFHHYVNPERDVPQSAVNVHGITTEMLQDKPLFDAIADDFLAFVGDARLIAHNADFDRRFINFELKRAGRPTLPDDQFFDTLAVARKKFPGQPNSLDALCRRFGVENAHRTLHGALLDAEILADVYIELTGGRQKGLELKVTGSTTNDGALITKKQRPRRHFPASATEIAAHATFLEANIKNPLWNRLADQSVETDEKAT